MLVISADVSRWTPTYRAGSPDAGPRRAVSRPPALLDQLSPEALAHFRQLSRAPVMAWPTVALFFVLVSSYALVYAMCLSGRWPLWLGTVLNAAVGYLAFSVGHDAVHRAISTHVRLNDTLGTLAMILILPYIDLRLFRWAHVLHHRFASGVRDPDRALVGPAWSLPLRWMVLDLLYFVYALRHGDKVSKPYLRQGLINAAIVAVIVATAVWAGYGMAVLMLWFIPSRLILITLGFSFFWLPHVPHEVSQEENFTRATTIRQGHEWLLGPLLQNQNYHLVHHLYPTTPFYNNRKVWLLLEAELRRHDLAIQHGFSIRPEIRLAPRREG